MNDVISEICYYSDYASIAVEKVKDLWVDKPSEFAFYKIKGLEVINGVLRQGDIARKYYYTAKSLTELRSRYPKVTLEEVIEAIEEHYEQDS